MRTGNRTLLAALVVISLVTAHPLVAKDPPHKSSLNTVVDCTNPCHAPHQDFYDSLRNPDSNVNLCQSCHNESGSASALPVLSLDEAVPHVGGFHHAFGVPAENSSAGASVPENSAMASRVMDGQVVCSTCHNQHVATPDNGGDSRIGAVEKLTALGAGTMESGGTFTGSPGVWYLIEIDGAGSQATATFRWSKDLARTWRASGVGCGNGAEVTLDDGVTITFDGAGGLDFQVGEQWQFNAAWPFLRAALDSGDNATGDRYCRDCHRTWTMDHNDVESYDGTVRSHPVGITLNANGRGYDRDTPLDGNGGSQGSIDADSNRSNDLRLDSAENVQCFTCHRIHYADSNILTEDQR